MPPIPAASHFSRNQKLIYRRKVLDDSLRYFIDNYRDITSMIDDILVDAGSYVQIKTNKIKAEPITLYIDQELALKKIKDLFTEEGLSIDSGDASTFLVQMKI